MCFKKCLYGTLQDIVQRDEAGWAVGAWEAESAEHQVGTADKAGHLNAAVRGFCGINHLCSPAPGSSDSSKPMARAVENRVQNPLRLWTCLRTHWGGPRLHPNMEEILRCAWTVCWLNSSIRDTKLRPPGSSVSPGPCSSICR